ncbi:PE family protein, partial [Mycobacterium asiaticum]|uniref:PE family protein n=1 Tax=Mycobacterium asiaticum TaxID=1790 RepID=UPI0012DB21AE
MVWVVPEAVAVAAADVERIGSAIQAANSAVLVSTSRVAVAAGDEVSAAVAALFSGHGQAYQECSALAGAFGARWAQAVQGAGQAYAGAEAANAAWLQSFEQRVLGALNAPTEALFGRPLIGDGVAGSAARPDGGAGGILYGNGGAGFSQSAAGVAGGRGGSAGLIGNGTQGVAGTNGGGGTSGGNG